MPPPNASNNEKQAYVAERDRRYFDRINALSNLNSDKR